MDPRPEIEREGHRYRRRSGSWVDVRNIRVARVLAGKVDAQARRDADLWGRCRAQDVADQVERAVDTSGGSRAAARAASSRRTLALDYRLEGPHRVLVVEARLSQAWREGHWGNYFSDQVRIEVQGGQQVRVQVSVFPRPRRTLPCPVLAEHTESALGLTIITTGDVLRTSVALLQDAVLNPALSWMLTKSGKPYVSWERPLPVATNAISSDTADTVELRMMIVVQAPPRRPATVYRDWFRRFLPGGLPELGRR